MLTVTDKAINFLMNLMQQMDEPKKVRVMLDNDVSDKSLSLVLEDAARDDDAVFVIQGITFLMAQALYEKAKPVDIDFIEYTPGAGFKITSGL
jgi:Fe-S cluster assembly iron-binding protein IscA